MIVLAARPQGGAQPFSFAGRAHLRLRRRGLRRRRAGLRGPGGGERHGQARPPPGLRPRGGRRGHASSSPGSARSTSSTPTLRASTPLTRRSRSARSRLSWPARPSATRPPTCRSGTSTPHPPPGPAQRPDPGQWTAGGTRARAAGGEPPVRGTGFTYLLHLLHLLHPTYRRPAGWGRLTGAPAPLRWAR